MALREYQEQAVEAALTASRNPVIVLPTGAGKSWVIAGLCKRLEGRVLVLAHRRELVEQNRAAMEKHIGEPVGIMSSTLGVNMAPRVISAQIQTASRRHLKKFDYAIIDEAHRVPGAGSMYRKVLAQVKPKNVFGLTATPWRAGLGRIDKKGGFFSGCCYEQKVGPLIDAGFLSRLRSKSPNDPACFNVDDLHVTRGEFKEDELEVQATARFKESVEELKRFTKGRKSVLVFACSSTHARQLGEVLECDVLLQATKPKERAACIERFRSGSQRFFVNLGVLTEGFDHPGIDCVAIVRATASPVLFAQMVGRGFRTTPKKKDCLILDFGRNIERFGPVDKLFDGKDFTHQPRMGGAPVVRKCEECGELYLASLTECPECGTVAKVKERYDTKASELDVISDGKPSYPPGMCSAYFFADRARRVRMYQIHKLSYLWKEDRVYELELVRRMLPESMLHIYRESTRASHCEEIELVKGVDAFNQLKGNRCWGCFAFVESVAPEYECSYCDYCWSDEVAMYAQHAREGYLERCEWKEKILAAGHEEAWREIRASLEAQKEKSLGVRR